MGERGNLEVVNFYFIPGHAGVRNGIKLEYSGWIKYDDEKCDKTTKHANILIVAEEETSDFMAKPLKCNVRWCQDRFSNVSGGINQNIMKARH